MQQIANCKKQSKTILKNKTYYDSIDLLSIKNRILYITQSKPLLRHREHSTLTHTSIYSYPYTSLSFILFIPITVFILHTLIQDNMVIRERMADETECKTIDNNRLQRYSFNQ